MTLFSTLNEPYVLLLFLYLGACSGLIYFILSYFFSLLDRRKLLKKDIVGKNATSKNQQKNQQKKFKKNTQTNLKSKEQNKNESNKKIRKENEKNEKKLKKIIFFKSTQQIFIKIIIKIGQIISQTGKFAVFVALCFTSFLINLKFNYGEINLICLAFFVLSFFIAGYFLKIVANFMRAIYTKRYKK